MVGVGHSPCPALGLGIALLHGGWEWGWLTQSAASADTRSPRAESRTQWGGGPHSSAQPNIDTSFLSSL